ncbi:hypothetical protein LXA43DRAFT_1095500 [Ganoderma leucocontextum]|nr:hypothetical protein LXA43DRAFT_1095500 [Ganoderma leucocontextum]
MGGWEGEPKSPKSVRFGRQIPSLFLLSPTYLLAVKWDGLVVEDEAAPADEPESETDAGPPAPQKRRRTDLPIDPSSEIPPPIPTPQKAPPPPLEEHVPDAAAADPPRYSFRKPGRHPAQEAGLVPRPMAEIRAEAEAKRHHAKMLQDAKAAQQSAKAVERSVNMDKFATVLNERAHREAEEATYFEPNLVDTSPPDGEDADNDNDEDLYSEGPAGPQTQSERSTREGSPAATKEAHSLEAQAAALLTSSTTSTHNSSESKKRKAAGEDQTSQPPKKLTAAEKRAHRQDNLLEEVSQLCQNLMPSTPALRIPPAHAPSTPAFTRKNGTQETSAAAFLPNWCRTLQERSRIRKK